MKVAGFGDNIMDKYINLRKMYPGGNAVNFAVYSKQLGAQSSYIGVFGTDRYAEIIKDSLIDMGIDVSHCVVREGESGYSEVILKNGNRIFSGWNGGGITVRKPMKLNKSDIEYLKNFDVIHAACYGYVEQELTKLKNLNALISFDFSDEEKYLQDKYLDKVCPNIDFASFSCEDMEEKNIIILLKKFSSRGVRYILATRGKKGQIFYDDYEFYKGGAKILNRELVDTMGAGDAFITSFIINLFSSGWRKEKSIDSETIKKALEKAALFAASKCLEMGAFGYGLSY